jgi:hypothetical protein
VHLVAPGGVYTDMSQYNPETRMLRNLAAYLYSGVTAVRSVGDPLDLVLKVRSTVNSGEKLGAQLFTCGPLFTAKGGHGTEYFKDMPPNLREQAEAQFTRRKPVAKLMSSSTPMLIASRPYSRLVAAPASSIVSTVRSFRPSRGNPMLRDCLLPCIPGMSAT